MATELLTIRISSSQTGCLLDHEKFSLRERDAQTYIFINPSCVYYMSWIVASDQFRQLSLLRRRHKVKPGIHCTEEAPNQAETNVCILVLRIYILGGPPSMRKNKNQIKTLK